MYYGKVLGDVAEIAAGVETGRGWATWAATVVGLAATIAVIAIVTRIARRALREEVGE